MRRCKTFVEQGADIISETVDRAISIHPAGISGVERRLVLIDKILALVAQPIYSSMGATGLRVWSSEALSEGFVSQPALQINQI